MRKVKLLVVLDAEYDPDRLTLASNDLNGLPSTVASWIAELIDVDEDRDLFDLREPIVYTSLADLQADIAEGRITGL